MRSENYFARGSNGLFGARGEGGSSFVPMEELNGPSASLDLRQEFENWRRANRINLRHWVVAEKMGGHAMRYVRWERGMVMLRGIHIEIAHVKLKTRAALV